jgi:hypothetical protein
MNGQGWVFQSAIQSRMSFSRAWTLLWAPRRRPSRSTLVRRAGAGSERAPVQQCIGATRRISGLSTVRHQRPLGGRQPSLQAAGQHAGHPCPRRTCESGPDSDHAAWSSCHAGRHAYPPICAAVEATSAHRGDMHIRVICVGRAVNSSPMLGGAELSVLTTRMPMHWWAYSLVVMRLGLHPGGHGRSVVVVPSGHPGRRLADDGRSGRGCYRVQIVAIETPR